MTSTKELAAELTVVQFADGSRIIGYPHKSWSAVDGQESVAVVSPGVLHVGDSVDAVTFTPMSSTTGPDTRNVT